MATGTWQRIVAQGAGRAPAWWRGSLRAAVDLLFPPHCAMCHCECEPTADGPLFCQDCHQLLAISKRPTCPRCALTCSESDVVRGACGDCRSRKLLFAAARTIGPYQDALRQAVLQAKHPAYEPLAIALGQRLSESMAHRPFAERPELVVPVPVYWLRRMWRSTPAADTIARALAKELAIPLDPGALVCRRYLRRQATLTPAERRQNVRGAFAVSRFWRNRVAGKRILLVDDVMTTGATAHEASRALLAADAAVVYVATVARSSPEFC